MQKNFSTRKRSRKEVDMKLSVIHIDKLRELEEIAQKNIPIDQKVKEFNRAMTKILRPAFN